MLYICQSITKKQYKYHFLFQGLCVQENDDGIRKFYGYCEYRYLKYICNSFCIRNQLSVIYDGKIGDNVQALGIDKMIDIINKNNASVVIELKDFSMKSIPRIDQKAFEEFLRALNKINTNIEVKVIMSYNDVVGEFIPMNDNIRFDIHFADNSPIELFSGYENVKQISFIIESNMSNVFYVKLTYIVYRCLYHNVCIHINAANNSCFLYNIYKYLKDANTKVITFSDIDNYINNGLDVGGNNCLTIDLVFQNNDKNRPFKQMCKYMESLICFNGQSRNMVVLKLRECFINFDKLMLRNFSFNKMSWWMSDEDIYAEIGGDDYIYRKIYGNILALTNGESIGELDGKLSNDKKIGKLDGELSTDETDELDKKLPDDLCIIHLKEFNYSLCFMILMFVVIICYLHMEFMGNDLIPYSYEFYMI